MFNGPLITIFCAGNKDGRLDTMRDVHQPLSSLPYRFLQAHRRPVLLHEQNLTSKREYTQSMCRRKMRPDDMLEFGGTQYLNSGEKTRTARERGKGKGTLLYLDAICEIQGLYHSA